MQTVQLGTVDGDELLEHLFGEVVRGVEVDGPQLLQVAVLHPVLLKRGSEHIIQFHISTSSH